jgi:hypothetical protein
MNKVEASARKSAGEYKPLLKLPGGKTKVLEQSLERTGVYCPRLKQYVNQNRMARGNTYATRAEAVAAAQAHIDGEIARLESQLAKYESMHAESNDDFMVRGINSTKKELSFWKGE